jgi:hypothetical protein
VCVKRRVRRNRRAACVCVCLVCLSVWVFRLFLGVERGAVVRGSMLWYIDRVGV